MLTKTEAGRKYNKKMITCRKEETKKCQGVRSYLFFFETREYLDQSATEDQKSKTPAQRLKRWLNG